jgi:hypothetical protein
MSNRRYLIEANAQDISQRFHEMLRLLELTGFTLQQRGAAEFAGVAVLSGGQGHLRAVICGSRREERYEITLDLLDPPDRHVPERECDAVALGIAELVAKALGHNVEVRYLGSIAGAQSFRAPKGEVRVRRALCG